MIIQSVALVVVGMFIALWIQQLIKYVKVRNHLYAFLNALLLVFFISFGIHLLLKWSLALLSFMPFIGIVLGFIFNDHFFDHNED